MWCPTAGDASRDPRHDDRRVAGRAPDLLAGGRRREGGDRPGEGSLGPVAGGAVMLDDLREGEALVIGEGIELSCRRR